MKFIPILFSTPMIQAIIEGRKTMTRRVMKPQPYPVKRHRKEIEEYFEWDASKKITDLPIQEWVSLCPYGKVGDILWVRETFVDVVDNDGKEVFIYKADDDFYKDTIENWKGWQPSLFMPKAACRIFLKITDIRVERLNEIREEDAKKEGVEFTIADKEKFGCRAQGMKLYRNYERKDNSLTSYPCNGFENSIISFQTLWQSINGKESWDANPWVWVIVFERIEKPTDFL